MTMNDIALTCAQARAIDEYAVDQLGMNSLVLMENAGRGAVDALQATGIEGPVLVCCYKGNNGGDGLVLARHLLIRGFEANVLLFCDPQELQGDAAANFQILRKLGGVIQVATDFGNAESNGHSPLDHFHWIVDGLLGTGASGDPRPPLDSVIRLLNAANCRRMALDLPSGLNGDTGQPGEPTLRADLTCTFAAPKVGLLANAAEPYVGDLTVVDIGVPPSVIRSIAD